MRIDPKAPVTPVVMETTRPTVAPASQRRDPAAVVKLSSAGAAAESRAADAEAKVARLREQVDAGTYKVNLEQLASRLLEDDPFGGS